MVADRALDVWRRLPPVVADAVLALVVAAVTVVSVLVESDDIDEPVTPAGWALLALQLVPLVWRRRAPVVVMAVCAVGAFTYGAMEQPDPAIMFAPVLSFYTVAAHRPRSVSVPAFLAMVALVPIVLVLARDTDPADVTTGYFAGITAWVVGDTSRGKRERTEWLEQRRDDEADRAVADERLRIARDLHDVVAHHVSVIAVQAEAAVAVAESRPDRARQAMVDVSDTARDALVELRRLLGVLRSEAATAPQPELGAIDDLVETVRRAGLDVRVRTTGEGPEPGAVVGLTAYRVVQEALTNVLKHASAQRADVGLDLTADALVVTVTDDGAGARSPRTRSGSRVGRHAGAGGGARWRRGGRSRTRGRLRRAGPPPTRSVSVGTRP